MATTSKSKTQSSHQGESHTTTDRDEIIRWAEERNGKPAIVKGTEGDDGSGLLRINFPGYAENNLEDTDWDTFFDTFEKKKLAFLYQDETKDGKESRFFKLVNRDNNQ